jgi:hypothetical protein
MTADVTQDRRVTVPTLEHFPLRTQHIQRA